MTRYGYFDMTLLSHILPQKPTFSHADDTQKSPMNKNRATYPQNAAIFQHILSP